jgi:surface protein
MFFGASNFNQDISSWNTSSVKKMENAFYNAANFNQNISGWNTSKVERSYSMFDGASVFNQDLGSWDISENENMTDMFTDAGLSVTNYSNILNGWAAQAPSIQSNVTLGASPTQYNAGAVASRNTLTGTYSWNITDGGLGLNTELFISGYGEGSSNNKYLQIYNPTNSDINLDNYKFKRCGNGCTDWEYTFPFPSSTIINSGEKITIANNSADTGILACADIPDILDPNNSRQSLCSFNGDDAIGLFKDDTLIDIIGEVGPDPGSGWEVAGVSNATANHTLVRKQTISSGNTDWSASAGTNANDSEWVVFPNDTNKACSYTSDYP